jgi:hypothetical protein
MKFLKTGLLSLRTVFILLVLFTILVALMMFFPDNGIIRGPSMFVLWILLAVAGLGLVIFTYRLKAAGKVRVFLLVSGFSSVGFLVGVVLHNLLYALAMLAENLMVIHTILNVLEAAAFMAAVILCPIGLLVGIIGTLILWKNIPSEPA